MLSLFFCSLARSYNDYDDIEHAGDFTYFINKKNEAVIGVYKSNHEAAIDIEYTGQITVDNTINHDGVDYPVAKIGNFAFFNTQIQSITIKGSVKKLGAYAFAECKCLDIIDLSKTKVKEIPPYCFFNSGIRNIILPDDLLTFGEMSFSSTPLLNLKVPDTVTDFGNMSVYSNKQLKNLDLSNTQVTSLKPSTFKNCYSLTDVKLPTKLTVIPDELFANTKIKTIELPPTIQVIGKRAFRHCTRLQSFTFPSKVYMIDEGAFKECASLDNLDMTNLNITELSAQVFKSCDSLRTIKLPKILTAFGDYALSGTSIVELTLPAEIVKVGKGAFSWCVSLKTADISALTTEIIPAEMFRMCTHLKSISLPAKINIIGEKAFEHCVTLPEIDLSKAPVSVIGTSAFSQCSALSSIILGETVSTINESAFASTAIPEFTAPQKLKTLGASAFFSCRKLKVADLVQSGLTELSDYSFSLCTSLTRITFPAKLVTIGEYALSGAALTTVALTSQVATIKSRAFANCDGLKNVDMSQTKVTVLNGTFRGCGKLATFKLPPELTCIEDSPFLGTALIPMPIPESLTSLGPSAFANTTFNGQGLPGILTAIGDYAFAWCASLQSIDLSHTSISVIGNYAFYNSSLKSIIWPKSITVIGAHIFELTRIEEFVVPETVTNLSYAAFEKSTIKSIDMSSSLIVELENRTFAHTPLLRTVTLPKALTKIGKHCFFDCGVAQIEFPATLEYIGPASFGNTHNLQSINFQNTKVENITEAAFFNSSVRTVILPTNCTIESWAFSCSDIILLDGNIRQFGYFSFFYCHNLGHITLNAESTFTEIPDRCFSHCGKLLEVALPRNLTGIMAYAFNNCTSLRQVNIQETQLRSIGTAAFANCTKLSGYTVPSTLSQIGDEAFMNTTIFLLEIGRDVSSIGVGAFRACTHLRSVVMAMTSVTVIPNRCFSGCFKLVDISLPLKVERIGNYAFLECGIKNIVATDSLKILGRMAFSGCYQLQSVDLSKASMNFLACGAFSNCTSLQSIILPEKLVAQNAKTPYWVWNSFDVLTNFYNETGNNDESQDEVVAEYSEPHEFVLAQAGTFSNDVSLKSLDLSKTAMKNIEPWFFYNSTKLTTVSFPPTLESLGEGALASTGIDKIELPSTLYHLGPSGFRNCALLEEADLKNINVTQLGSSMFLGTRSLKKCSLPQNLTTMGSFFFFNSSIPNVEIPPSVERIGRSTFAFSDVESVDFSKTKIDRIPDHCFLNATKLKYVNISSETKVIGRSAFANSGIEKFYLSEGIEYIEPFTFFGCHNLKYVDLTHGKINRLPYGIFSHCTSLEEVHLPSNLMYVDESSFEVCTSLERVYYLGCNVIETNALANINSKTQVRVLVLENYPHREFLGIRVEAFYDSGLEDEIEFSLCAKKGVVKDPRPRFVPKPKYPKGDDGKLMRITYNEND